MEEIIEDDIYNSINFSLTGISNNSYTSEKLQNNNIKEVISEVENILGSIKDIKSKLFALNLNHLEAKEIRTYFINCYTQGNEFESSLETFHNVLQLESINKNNIDNIDNNQSIFSRRNGIIKRKSLIKPLNNNYNSYNEEEDSIKNIEQNTEQSFELENISKQSLYTLFDNNFDTSQLFSSVNSKPPTYSSQYPVRRNGFRNETLNQKESSNSHKKNNDEEIANML